MPKGYKTKSTYVEGHTVEDIEITLKNLHVYIKAWSYETRYSWGHKCDCAIYTFDENQNGKVHTASNKCVYYNRTWESYRFQSCINGAIRKACGKDTKLADKIITYLNKKKGVR